MPINFTRLLPIKEVLHFWTDQFKKNNKPGLLLFTPSTRMKTLFWGDKKYKKCSH